LLPLQNNKSYSVLQLFFPICQRTYAKRALASPLVCDVVGFEPLGTAFTVTSWGLIRPLIGPRYPLFHTSKNFR